MAEKKRIWDNFVHIGEVQKSEATKLVVSAATRDGYRCINVREWYMKKSDNEWKPGRDGINVPLLSPIKGGKETLHVATGFADLILKCIEQLPDIALVDEDNAVYYTKED